MGQDLGSNTSGLTTAGGVSTADLRGLGPNRTLVLVNGRRLGVGSPYTRSIQAPNLDQIPTFLLERVDVVTGGASAVYGSDAYRGRDQLHHEAELRRLPGRLSHQARTSITNDSTYMHQLATEAGVAFPTGYSKDGRHPDDATSWAAPTSLTARATSPAYFSYHRAQPVSSANRDFGAVPARRTTTDTNLPVCAGSSNSNLFQWLARPERRPGHWADDVLRRRQLSSWRRAPGHQAESAPAVQLAALHLHVAR